MNSRQRIERILGGKITSFDQEGIPGLTLVDGVGVVYFEDFEGRDLASKMRTLTRHVHPPLVTVGGVATTSHTLTTPTGRLFHAVEFHGDLRGWQEQIKEGARALNLVLGRIQDGSDFVLSSGDRFSLDECRHGTI